MNIKNYFNVKLYLQAIKRLKVVGIISAILLGIYAFMIPVITYIENNDAYYYEELDIIIDSESYVYDIIQEPKTYDFIDASSSDFCALYTVLYLIVPIMSVILFHFMTSRNGSDFYHSLPTKRRAVYLSFIGAIATWSLILIAIFSIIMGITYAFIPYTVVNPLNILIFTLNIFISCILMAAGFGLGCCLSGTILSNLVTSLSILYLPRLLITLFCVAISASNPLVSLDGMFVLSRYNCNMLFAGIADPFIHELTYSKIDSFGHLDFSTLYTLILAIIYIVLGSIVYTKRPSETAGKSAISSKLQIILRLILGYTISLLVVIPLYIHVEMNKSHNYSTDYCVDDLLYEMGGPIYILIIYLITFIVMFLYELITTKSTKKAVKSFITAPLIIVANIVTVVILCQINYNSFFYRPSVEDIDYVQFQFDYDLFAETATQMINADANTSYFDDADTIINGVTDIKITDKEMLELVSDLVSKSINRTKKEYYLGCADYFGIYNSWQYNSEIKVTIKDGLFEKERYLYLTDEEIETIIKHLLEHKDTKNIYSSYPVAHDNYVYIRQISGLTEEQTQEVYNAFINDLKNISPLDYMESFSTDSISNVCILFIDHYDKGEFYTDILDVTYATPTATSLFIKYHKENADMTFETLYNMISSNTSSYSVDFNLEVFSYSLHTSTDYRIDADDNETSDKILNMIKATSDMVSKYEYLPEDISSIDLDKYYLCCARIFYYMWDHEYIKDEFTYYFLIDKNKLDPELLKSFDTSYYKN